MLLIVSTTASPPRSTRWWRDLVFHLAGILTANVGLALWATGVSLSMGLAITYFGLVVALGTLLACRWFARVERRRAGIVLGAPIAEHYAPLEPARWTARLHALLGDSTTWRDFAWTGVSGVIGMTLSGLAVTLWGCVLGLVTLPAWYWAIPGGAELGIVDVDTLPLALGAAAAGLVLVPVAGYLVRGLTIVELAFPGTPEPAEVVVQAADVTSPQVSAGIAQMRAAALATGRMFEPIEVTTNPAQTLAIVHIPMRGADSETAVASLAALRDDVLPATIERVPGTTVNVTGATAGSEDFNDAMKSHLPLVFGFVLGAAFLLLLVTFRSLVIPIKAIVLNLLSVGAAYGVLTLVFQHGWGASLLGFETVGGITSWLPLFLFVVLFGLSMDYHVFILSRIREAVLGGARTEAAVADGIKSTAGVVTSAAAVMIAVFAIFATLGAIEFKQMGVGLAVAVLIDATIVRAVLLPATMKLLGEWNWYLPRGLSWLPRVTGEVSAQRA
jgi:predicted RND superfamily exporter protein